MEQTTLALSRRLYYSLRFGGWSKIFVPTALGAVVAYLTKEEFPPGTLFLASLIALSCIVSIIFINDLADEKVDRIKRKMFPKDSSPKTLPDKLLSKNLVFFLAFISSLALVGIGTFIEFSCDRSYFTLMTALMVLANFSYSFWPLKLNYRFGGEFLEALGVGIGLPYSIAYLGSGLLWHPSYLFFLGFFFLALASALCSGICDVASDKKGGKKTFSVLLGNKVTLYLILLSLIASAVSFMILSYTEIFNHLMGLGVILVFLTTLNIRELFRFSQNKDLQHSLPFQKKFRNFLHKLTSAMIFLLFLCLFLNL